MGHALPPEVAAALGAKDFEQITDTSEHTGQFVALLAIDADAVVNFETDRNTITSHTLQQNVPRLAPFTSVTRVSGGDVWAYFA